MQVTTPNDHDEEKDEESDLFFGLLDRSERNYFQMIENALISDEFTSDEDRNIFVENVFREAKGKEAKLATAPLGSSVLEKLLKYASTTQVKQLFQAFQGDFVTLIAHKISSHVCEMLFAMMSTAVVSEMTSQQADDTIDSAEKLFLAMLDEIAPRLTEMSTNPYASHVIRDILLILNGTLFANDDAGAHAKRYHAQKKFSWSRPTTKLVTPSSFRSRLIDMVETLSSLSQVELRTIASEPHSMPLAQTLLILNKDLSETNKVARALLGEEAIITRDDFIEALIQEPSGSRLMETLIEVLDTTQYELFYRTYIQGRSPELAQSTVTNFVLQQVISLVENSTIIEELVDELTPCFQELVKMQLTLVIQKLVYTCARLGACTDKLFRGILSAYNESDKPRPEFILKVMHSPASKTEDSFSLQGAYLIKALFALSPKSSDYLNQCILQLSTDLKCDLATSPAGILVVQAFLDGQITLIQRKQFLNAYSGRFADIACHPTGSRFADLCWHATMPLKIYQERFAQELSSAHETVRGNFYGRIVWRNWHMDAFRNKRAEWHRQIAAANAKAKQGLSKTPVIESLDAPDRTDGARKAKRKAKKLEQVDDEIDAVFAKKSKV